MICTPIRATRPNESIPRPVLRPIPINMNEFKKSKMAKTDQ